MTPVADVLYLQPRRITRSKLSINCENEHRKLANIRRHLKSHPDHLDFSEFQRRLLPSKFALVPWQCARLSAIATQPVVVIRLSR